MTTRALVVGINNYPGTNALPSCVQDATAFSTHLQSKFAFQEIKALTDQQASKHAVLDGLAWLFNGATPQDRLVFFYSGHGYRPQINGELREALVTQDSRFLDDTELADAMVSVPDGVLTIVLDTCFSGGLEKLFIAEDGRIAHVVKSKFWTAEAPTSQVISSKGFEPAAVSFRPFGLVLPPASKGYVPGTGDATVTTLTLPASKGLLISAAQADETASASTPGTNGMSAFTYALLDQVDQLGAARSSIDLVLGAGNTLRRLFVKQTPAIKLPIKPAGMGQLSFLKLDPLAASSPANVSLPSSHPSEVNVMSAYMSSGLNSSALLAGQSLSVDKAWYDSITRAVSTALPIVLPIVTQAMQSKCFSPTAQAQGLAVGSVDEKAWYDSISRAVSTALPIVLPMVTQAMQSKGFSPTAQAQGLAVGSVGEKAWYDSITRAVSTALPIVLPIVTQAIQSKGFSPAAQAQGLAMGSVDEKAWYDSISRAVSTALPIVLPMVTQAMQTKGFTPAVSAGTPNDEGYDKAWYDTVLDVAKTVAPIALALV
ncbi:hypothetical protein CFBP498_12260 [Xanthomonas hortorum pv. vitians]|uniref:Caspase family protein n=1 Tax=Xanthomonas hortorum pv. vitians TaxID=83224 RepID=A0A6V7CD12_9XANT|nr:caspase family protein [Xanthomonas hortorum]MDT7826351.1 caspase family protein [Xanthomonas hortorum pv. vitians]MDV7247233.1 caspase family protein [Xanthomonas hortorum pv. vitians]NMI32675.1 caspase family protein [Xanthomonas hortorum pv. vitians]CAD0314286.1 hypothetical protein CFBP498_12260 [Xanthomonas hortorum pv. vitians]CAD0314296.1 hypothetical protein CFBP498_12260 [Xanthomonas hortorum pv. vitians]